MITCMHIPFYVFVYVNFELLYHRKILLVIDKQNMVSIVGIAEMVHIIFTSEVHCVLSLLNAWLVLQESTLTLLCRDHFI